MREARLIPVVALLTAGVVAGCGSNSSSGKHSASSKAVSNAAQPAYAPSSAGGGSGTTSVALVTTKHSKLGTILAFGPKQLTVYLFEGDRRQSSSCAGACASAWPPVTGRPQAGSGAMASQLGTIERPDGTTQVTYKGHPLYTFIKDKDGGDAYGQGVKAFGAQWYTLAPSGNKVDKS
jgi:predicted lipoprotein with Yx(FWY)xxD motif